MLIKTFDEEKLMDCAKEKFPNAFIEMVSVDLFLKGVEAGKYQAPWLDHEFFVSTEYAYEDVEVNGNQTRCKITMQGILIKKDRYTVIYDAKDVFYVAYEEQGEIHFQKYVEFLKEVPKSLIPIV